MFGNRLTRGSSAPHNFADSVKGNGRTGADRDDDGCTHKVGRQTVTDKADLTAKVIRYLRSLQNLPALVRSFFRAPEVA